MVGPRPVQLLESLESAVPHPHLEAAVALLKTSNQSLATRAGVPVLMVASMMMALDIATVMPLTLLKRPEATILPARILAWTIFFKMAVESGLSLTAR